MLLALLLATACAETTTISPPKESPWSRAHDIATRADLTCAADGSVSLTAEQVQPRPDGVHIRVINEYDEPV